uniref:Putative e3 ubiquitin-protein ligase trim37 n=1 Tax=Culex tarsalis TaxID=7177 RepID=A0A1Q3F996_CULTA
MESQQSTPGSSGSKSAKKHVNKKRVSPDQQQVSTSSGGTKVKRIKIKTESSEGSGGSSQSCSQVMTTPKTPVPASAAASCSSCKESIANPICCSRCQKQFCWKCFDCWLSFTQRTMCPPCVEEEKRGKTELCRDHDAELNLFCLTCGVRICGGCFLNTPDHKRHVIDNLDDVYREVSVQMEKVLGEVGQALEEFGHVVLQTEFNEQLIRRNGAEICEELEQLVGKAKVEANRWLEDKMTLCKLRKEAPVKRSESFRKLQEQVRLLPKHELIQQFERIKEEANGLVPNAAALHPPEIDGYDFESSLTSHYVTESIEMENFFRHFESSKYEQIGSAMLVDSSVTVWNVRVFKGTHLTVELSQQNSLKHRIQFRVFIEVPHDDPRQTLRVQHETEINSDRVEVIEMDKLKELGFVTEADVLRLRVGIKPTNVVLQLQALASNLIELKKEHLTLKEKYMKLEKKLNETEEFTVGYFRIPLEKLQFSNRNKDRRAITLRSHEVIDHRERSWCLYVVRAKANRRCNESYLSVFIKLNSRTKKQKQVRRRYYVELVNHDDRQYSLRKYGSDGFSLGTRIGWSPFERMSRVFADDSGFVEDGRISFRFGIHNPRFVKSSAEEDAAEAE